MGIIKKINEARNYLTENSKTHLNNVAAKVIGFISILIALGILGGLSFGMYKLALAWELGRYPIVIFPFSVMSLAALLAASVSSIPCFQYGKDMLQAKFEVPKNPNDIERDSL